METPTLGFYCIPETGSTVPKMATDGSACFDIRTRFHPCDKYDHKPIIGYGPQNVESELFVNYGSLEVQPGWRVLVPTGLILDIPEGYSVRLHPRSGNALKDGLVLANAEGVIDSDYTKELMVMVYLLSSSSFRISDGFRLCQAELVKNQPVKTVKLDSPPNRKTDRDGGFGSTGVK